jgi:hypothetical protein
MENVLFTDLQFVVKHLMNKKGSSVEEISLSHIHAHYFGKDKYQRHNTQADTIAAFDVVLEGCKRVNLDISNNVKHYQLLYTNQPSSSQDLFLENILLN